MSSKRTQFLVVFNLAVCTYALIRIVFFAQTRTLRNDLVQGILIGFAMSFVTAHIFGRIRATKANGWITFFGCGLPENGMLMRSALALTFPGPVNVPQEAMYWTTSADGAGRTLKGKNNYILHFPPGGLPPNQAFWSLTMGDSKNRFVPNLLDRYSVSDRSGLEQNADGSVDIYLQEMTPEGHESNWLPAPSGEFILWLRVYIPGQAILDREYEVPPVVEVK